jgi:hypothetical protein
MAAPAAKLRADRRHAGLPQFAETDEPVEVCANGHGRVLPVSIPPLLGFLSWAYTLAITHAHEETHDWLYTNFVLLVCNTDYLEPGKAFTLDFWRGGQNEMLAHNPFLEARAVGYEDFLSLRDSLVPNFIKAIEQNFYPMAFVDESCLAYSSTFGSGQFYPHHTLLYGYDAEEEFFYALGFGSCGPDDVFGRFGPQRVTFRELAAAAESMQAGLQQRRIEEQLTYFLRLKKLGLDPIPPSFSFDIDMLRQSLLDYLEGCSYLGRLNHNMLNAVVGLRVYEQLDRYFLLAEEGRIGADREDVRHLHILEDHKRLMVERLRYLAKKNIAAQADIEPLALAWQALADKLYLAKLRAMRNSTSTAPRYCRAMRKLLQEQKEGDAKLVTALLKLL